MSYYDKMTQDQEYTILKGFVAKMEADEILSYGTVYEEFKHQLGNEVFNKFVQDNPPGSEYLRTYGETVFDLWQERDRLHLHLTCEYTNETLLEFWDEEAQQFLEDHVLTLGFSKENLHQEVYRAYVRNHNGDAGG